MSDVPNFNDLTPIEVVVPIDGKSYTLREASGVAATRYANAKLERMTLKDGKPVSLKGMADTESLLVSFCLFDAANNPVPLATIQAWPNRVGSWLFDEAKKISNIDQEESLADLTKQRDELNEKIAKLQESAGNLPQLTEAGSA